MSLLYRLMSKSVRNWRAACKLNGNGWGKNHVIAYKSFVCAKSGRKIAWMNEAVNRKNTMAQFFFSFFFLCSPCSRALVRFAQLFYKNVDWFGSDESLCKYGFARHTRRYNIKITFQHQRASEWCKIVIEITYTTNVEHDILFFFQIHIVNCHITYTILKLITSECMILCEYWLMYLKSRRKVPRCGVGENSFGRHAINATNKALMEWYIYT